MFVRPLILLPLFLIAVASSAQDSSAAKDDSVDKIVFRSGTVFEGQIVEGTKSLIDDPNRYEILLNSGSLVSILDTGQIETVVMDGQTLDDPQMRGGRKRLREMLFEHFRRKEAMEERELKDKLTASVNWLTGDVRRVGAEEGATAVPVKLRDRIVPGETLQLTSTSRIVTTVAGRIDVALEEGSLFTLSGLAFDEDETRLTLDFALERGTAWFDKGAPQAGVDEVEIRVRGLTVLLEDEGTLRVRTARSGEVTVSHYSGPQFDIVRQSDGAKVKAPPEIGFAFAPGDVTGEARLEPRRFPLDDYNSWLEFTAWRPVEVELPLLFTLVGKPRMEPRSIRPLIGLPSEKFVFQDLQPLEETGLAGLLESYRGALTRFKTDVGRHPTEEEGLAILRSATGEIEGWSGPYLGEGIPTADPWGRSLRYSVIQAGEQRLINLYSVGENGVDEQGLGDDLR